VTRSLRPRSLQRSMAYLYVSPLWDCERKVFASTVTRAPRYCLTSMAGWSHIKYGETNVMRLCALGCIVVACALSAAARAADSELDTATKDTLEGVWLIDQRPVGSCARSIPSNDQISFEFRKSQGRLLVYQPLDIFAALPIVSGMRSGDVITLRMDEGGKPRALTFRIFADRLEILAS